MCEEIEELISDLYKVEIEETAELTDHWDVSVEIDPDSYTKLFKTNIKKSWLTGTVTQILNNKELIINGQKHVKYDRSYITDLSVGDLVNVEKTVKNEVIVKPIVFKILTAKTTDCEEDSKQLLFSDEAILLKKSLSVDYCVGDLIKCFVIRTETQNQYKWRAYPYKHVWDPEVKNGIRIDQMIKFDLMVINSSKKDVISISNIGEKTQILISVDIINTKKQIHLISIGDTDSSELVIQPKRVKSVRIEFKPEYCGHHKELIVFKFNGFEMRRYVTFTVIHQKSGLTGFSYLEQSEQYNISDKFTATLEECLDKTNHKQQFHTLLWMEELEELKTNKPFKTSNITVEIVNDLFVILMLEQNSFKPKVDDKVFIIGDYPKINQMFKIDEKRITSNGVVEKLTSNGFLVRFSKAFHKEYTKELRYTISFGLNRQNYIRQHLAIDLAVHLSDQLLFPTNNGIKEPLNTVSIESIDWFNPNLNAEQKMAVIGVLRGECRPNPFILFGPPGTGKTVTVVESILQVFHRIPYSRIIACTAMNSSADLIVQKLLDSTCITEEDLRRVSALSHINCVPDSIESVVSLAGDCPEDWLYHRIIVTTTSMAGVIYSENICRDHFSHLFIDEAAQVTEPETLIPITLNGINKGLIVLAGDHKQLGPVVQSNQAKNGGLSLSLMERLITGFEQYKRNETYREFGYSNPKFVVKLVNNFRSDAQIMTIPSKLFYDNELKFNIETDRKLLESLKLNSAINFHGIKGRDVQDEGSFSWYNPGEINQVCSYLERLYNAGVKPEDIGIITPYRKQEIGIKNKILEKELKQCKIATIEKFQGLENRVIIVSTVRSVPNKFIYSPNRFNVAVSRAQSLLIIIGNPLNLRRTKCWSDLLNYCRQNNSYYGFPLSNRR